MHPGGRRRGAAAANDMCCCARWILFFGQDEQDSSLALGMTKSTLESHDRRSPGSRTGALHPLLGSSHNAGWITEARSIRHTHWIVTRHEPAGANASALHHDPPWSSRSGVGDQGAGIRDQESGIEDYEAMKRISVHNS
jgi:hypothetical protein